MELPIVGQRIKRLRENLNLSQAKLAGELGINQAVLARYELSKILPSFPVLIKFADYFNVSTDYLLGRTDDTQGKLYGRPFAAEELLDEFIEMCFDPTTEVNAKLKEAMRKIMSEQNKKKE